MDNRLEFEVGVTDRFQTAIYLNTKRETVEDAAGDLQSESTVDGFSLEFKYKLADAAADPIGFAVYGEFSMASDEAEIELKAIADKQIGRHLIAANLTYEPAAEFAANGTVIEQKIEGVAAYAFLLNPNVSIGLEAREQNVVVEDEGLISSTLFAGPAVHVSVGDWWLTGTWLPQLHAFRGETNNSGLDLEERERYEIRLIGGIHF